VPIWSLSRSPECSGGRGPVDQNKESVETDEDDDYLVSTPDGHHLWVRLYTDADPASVQVFSVLAINVQPAPGLLEELNSINGTAAHIKVLWASGAVMAEVDLVAQTLTLPEFANAVHVVRRTAERHRDILISYFGTPLDEAPPKVAP
jgi:hypothetical protein